MTQTTQKYLNYPQLDYQLIFIFKRNVKGNNKNNNLVSKLPRIIFEYFFSRKVSEVNVETPRQVRPFRMSHANLKF